MSRVFFACLHLRRLKFRGWLGVVLILNRATWRGNWRVIHIWHLEDLHQSAVIVSFRPALEILWLLHQNRSDHSENKSKTAFKLIFICQASSPAHISFKKAEVTFLPKQAHVQLFSSPSWQLWDSRVRVKFTSFAFFAILINKTVVAWSYFVSWYASHLLSANC